MAQGNVGSAERHPRSFQGRQDLLVEAVRPSNVVAEREEADVIELDLGAMVVSTGCALHDITGLIVGSQAIEQVPDRRACRRVDHIIGVEPEGVIARGMGECHVAGRREIVDPVEVDDACAERLGDLSGPVEAARVDDHGLIEESACRFQAAWQVVLLVPDDHGQADPEPGFPASRVPAALHEATEFLQETAVHEPAPHELCWFVDRGGTIADRFDPQASRNRASPCSQRAADSR